MGQRNDLGDDEKPDLLGYVLPKTVVGLALWLLIFAMGAGASGAVFFIAYERRQTELESRITAVRSELEQRLADAVAQLQQADRANAVTGTGTSGLAQANRLIAGVGPSLVTVQGVDATGARTSGSGFVMNSTASQAWLITSSHLVAGSVAEAQGLPLGSTETPTATATVAPPTLGVTPTVTVHIVGSDRTGTVYSWDAAHDLALVIVGAGSLPALTASSAVPTQGLPVSSIGAADGPVGASAAKGQLLAPTPQSYTTDAVFGPRASGGPLVDGEGK